MHFSGWEGIPSAGRSGRLTVSLRGGQNPHANREREKIMIIENRNNQSFRFTPAANDIPRLARTQAQG